MHTAITWSSQFGDCSIPKQTLAARFGGFCSDVEGFDADLFRFPPAEAAATDPAHRILMERTVTALADAELCLASKLSPATGVALAFLEASVFADFFFWADNLYSLSEQIRCLYIASW